MAAVEDGPGKDRRRVLAERHYNFKKEE